MSEEQLKAFLEKVKADTSLQEKLKAAGDANAVVEIAKAAGFTCSIDNLNHVPPEEITENELETATGGMPGPGGCATPAKASMADTPYWQHFTYYC